MLDTIVYLGFHILTALSTPFVLLCCLWCSGERQDGSNKDFRDMRDQILGVKSFDSSELSTKQKIKRFFTTVVFMSVFCFIVILLYHLTLCVVIYTQWTGACYIYCIIDKLVLPPLLFICCDGNPHARGLVKLAREHTLYFMLGLCIMSVCVDTSMTAMVLGRMPQFGETFWSSASLF